MSGLSKAVKAASAALVVYALAPQAAVAVELIPKLDCALTQTTHADGKYCLKIFNTCDSSIASRIEESGGVQKDSPEVKPGERGKVCSAGPFAFLGHYIAGPLAEGSGY